MKIISVNVSQPTEIIYNERPVMTGIYKEPVTGRISLREFNFAGDKQADLVAHGGTYKAVYVYPHEHYAHWSKELSRHDFSYGQFGENLTTEGLSEDTVHIGDVFRIGSALVEVTQPRVPCFKLEHKMGIRGFIKLFHLSRLTGFYLRVLEEGEVGAGDEIELVKTGEGSMTIREIHNLMYFDTDDLDGIRRAITLAALAPGWRDSFAESIAKAGG